MSEKSISNIVPRIRQSVNGGMINEDYEEFLRLFKEQNVSVYALHLIIRMCLNSKERIDISQSETFYKYDEDEVEEEISRLKIKNEQLKQTLKDQRNKYIGVIVVLSVMLFIFMVL